MLKRVFFVLLRSLVAFSLIIFAAASSYTYAEEESLKIGFIGPLTGPVAAYGNAAKNGFELGLEEYGDSKLEILYEDDAYSAAKAVAAFKKLTEVNKVDLVIGLASTPANAVAPLAQRRGTPFIAWANDPKVAQNRSKVILSEQSALHEGKLIARKTRDYGFSKVALLSVNGDYHEALVQGLKKELGDSRIVFHERVDGSERNFRSLLLKLRRKNPDAIGMCLDPGQFGLLAKQAKELGLKVNFFGCNAMQDPSEFEVSAGALKGAWFVGLPISEEFAKKYEEQFGNKTVISGAGLHYELAKLLSEIAESDWERNNLIASLLKTGKRSGVVGNYQVSSEDGLNFFDIEMVVKTFGDDGTLREG